MNLLKRTILRLLIRMLDSSLKLNYKEINKKEFENWAFRSVDDMGFKSYLGYEDLKILKALGQGQERDQYMILIGRRIQLLYLADEMRKAFELKKSAEEKRKSEAQNKNN